MLSWLSVADLGIWGRFCREKQSQAVQGVLSAALAAGIALKIELKELLLQTGRAWLHSSYASQGFSSGKASLPSA